MAQILIFKGIHRNTWHYCEDSDSPELRKSFRGVCGNHFLYRFTDYDYVQSDALPPTMCSKCFRYLTGEKKPKPKSQPVKLEFKAMIGVNEGWRPDFMKKSQ